MITIYLDMDGVLCDFDRRFMELFEHREYDPRLFREAVLRHRIFETLDWMPHGKELLEGIVQIRNSYSPTVQLEILSSTGTSELVIREQAIAQKSSWLDKHGIDLPRNFSTSKVEKSKWAHKGAILIDDRPGCVLPFRTRDGRAVLHEDRDYLFTLSQVRDYITEILRLGYTCGNMDL
jgi:hypothetical protein